MSDQPRKIPCLKKRLDDDILTDFLTCWKASSYPAPITYIYPVAFQNYKLPKIEMENAMG